MIPPNFYSDRDLSDGKRRVIEFEDGEIVLEHGIVQRIEFTDKRCNLTLRNPSPKRHAVHVKVWVLNKSLVEVWHQSEWWALTSLQPDQSHVVSWDFKPAVPSVVWNEKARDLTPAWIVIDSL